MWLNLGQVGQVLGGCSLFGSRAPTHREQLHGMENSGGGSGSLRQMGVAEMVRNHFEIYYKILLFQRGYVV